MVFLFVLAHLSRLYDGLPYLPFLCWDPCRHVVQAEGPDGWVECWAWIEVRWAWIDEKRQINKIFQKLDLLQVFEG